jgi:enediyne biosynthesis protein E4
VNSEQSNYLFHNNGDGSFAAVSNASIVSDIAEHRSVTWVDYDSDGYVDLFSTTGLNQPRRLYHNNHDGTFTRITQGAFLTVLGGFIGVAWGDYNNDGRPDLFLPSVNEEDGLPNYLYRNDGGGTFTRVGAGTTLDGTFNSNAAAWGDYDNDGDLDLFVSCAWPPGPVIGRPNLFYRNNGDGTFTKITTGSLVNEGGDSWATAWGDYDNDGFLDLFVGNFDGASFLHHNSGNDNHWLKFRLIGTRSNRAAIGAKVRVYATINAQTFWQMREIPGGDGLKGQNSLYV